MNRRLLMLLVLNSLVLVQAQTALYGEANAFTRVVFNEAGTAMTISGAPSEFGIRGAQPLSNSTSAYFDVNFGFNLTEFRDVGVREGRIGVEDSFGKVEIFGGNTPLTQSNSYLTLTNYDRISLESIFTAPDSLNAGIPTGNRSVDGLGYESPKIGKGVSLNAAVVPAENAGGETGFSFAANYDDRNSQATVAFDINVENPNSQLLRIIGHTQWQNLTLGLGLQAASNSANDSFARTYLGYAYLPLDIGQKQTRLKAVLANHQTTVINRNATGQLYFSLLNEVPLTNSASVYGMFEWIATNDYNDKAAILGAGMKIDF